MPGYGKYEEILLFREQEINHVSASSLRLNLLHDELMKRTITLAYETVCEDKGPAPSPFSFFVMGSAGRQEQGIWSDQDHGIIFQASGIDNQDYFLRLGEEISEGLFKAGYKKCDGNVMACNPLWCKSKTDWEEQVHDWIGAATWESIRHLLTFIDGRPIYGEPQLLSQLKQCAYQSIHDERLFIRLLQNTMHVRKGVGVLGQFLPETHGPYAGMLNLKDTGLFPYVNAARLLAIREGILETSTIKRLLLQPDTMLPQVEWERIGANYDLLNRYRLAYASRQDYESGHYLAVEQLTKSEKKQLKEIYRTGSNLFEFVRKLVEKEDRNGYE